MSTIDETMKLLREKRAVRQQLFNNWQKAPATPEIDIMMDEAITSLNKEILALKATINEWAKNHD